MYSMAMLVSFYCHCRGETFYDLLSAGAEWGAYYKLDLVKEPADHHVPLCVIVRVYEIPGLWKLRRAIFHETELPQFAGPQVYLRALT